MAVLYHSWYKGVLYVCIMSTKTDYYAIVPCFLNYPTLNACVQNLTNVLLYSEMVRYKLRTLTVAAPKQSVQFVEVHLEIFQRGSVRLSEQTAKQRFVLISRISSLRCFLRFSHSQNLMAAEPIDNCFAMGFMFSTSAERWVSSCFLWPVVISWSSPAGIFFVLLLYMTG